MIIMKFGGTSVKDADAMRKVIKIVSSLEKEKPLVVLSACAGMTDKLIDLITNTPKNELSKSNGVIDEIESRHLKMINDLIQNKNQRDAAKSKIKEFIEELRRLIEGVKLLKECTDRNTAQATAYGELLSTTVFNFAFLSKGFKIVFLDARTFIKTNSNYLNGKIDFDTIPKNKIIIKKLFSQNSFVVTQGFIASDTRGVTTTLGRGGSDFSAAIFGATLKAKEIQIWTDVSGVLTTDPRLVKSAVTIPEITFSEMRELSFYGAKVLHPDTIKPAIENNIPVRILNTYKPNDRGTVILHKIPEANPNLHSVILKQHCIESKIDVPSNVNSQKYFSEKINIFNKANLKILYSVCTEANIRIIFEANPKDRRKIKEQLGTVNTHLNNVSVLCVSCSNLDEFKSGTKSKSRIMEKFLKYLDMKNIRQILYGTSPVSILILTSPENGISTLKKIHSFILSEVRS